MSSNIQIGKICQHCNKEFIARTTVTKYCSHKCSRKAYKENLKLQKIDVANKETQQVITRSLEELKAKEFLSISDMCKLLGVSRWTIWRAIKEERIKVVKFGRRSIAKRSDLDKLFDQPQPITTQPKETPKPIQYKITDCYKLTDVENKYNISGKALYELIKRNNIPKIKQDRFVYVPKVIIDKLLNPKTS